VLDTLLFSMFVDPDGPSLSYNQRRLSTPDAVIPRIGASISHFGTAVVRHFEQMGVFTLASSQAITVSRDKLRAIQVLARHDIAIPPSAFARDRASVLPAIEHVGGAPVILKLLEGTQGIGVILAETTKVAEAIVETLQSARQNVLIQKFVAESRGRDLRAFVVGDRVVAAMRRVAAKGEFRSNVHRGARAEAVELPEDYARTAISAAQILGLRVAGVDMLETSSGPQVLEVNSSPGLEGIESATGVDIASCILEHLEQAAPFPELDLRQRLTSEAGYGVADLEIGANSPLAGLTLGTSRLRDFDVLVLNIMRGERVVPNPKGNEVLLPGDLLLCYGSLEALRKLVPNPEARRSQRPSVLPPRDEDGEA